MMTAEACCRQAATLLEGMLVDEHPAHCTTLNDLARAYMCCHIVADVDPLELLAVSKGRKSTEKPDVATDGEEVDTEAYHDCCTLDMEHCATKMADRALELWEQVVASGLELEKQQLVTTIEFVSVLADIYRLSHRVSEEYRALVVLMQLVTSGDHPLTYLRAYTDLALLYTRLNQPHLALPLVETITTWLQADSPKTCLATTQYVSFHLAAAETHLQAGQVNLGCEALSKAMKIKNDNFKPNSTDTLTLDARINRMAAIILTLPPSYHEDGHPNCCLDDDVENAFELEVKGTRSISGVMCFMMGEWLVRRKGNNDKVPVNTLNKWSLLDELVTSLHSTGTTCVRLGEASDARFYLQQGLKLAQGFHLPRRFAAFHLALSHLDNVSGRFTDSQSHMNVAFYTLNSADPAPRATPITPTEEDTDDEMTIKTRPIEMSEVLEDAVEASQNVIGSPTARRWKPHAALCWSHLSDCSCWHCSDVLGHRLHLLHLAQQAYCLFQQGLHVQAEAFWNLLLQNFDAVTNRARHTLQVLMSLVPNANVNEVTALPLKKGSQPCENYAQSGFKVNPSMFQRLLVSVCEQLTELAVTQENWELYEQWVSKASDLLSTESYPWMIACHASLAHTLYLRVLPALPAPKVEQKSHFQELCDRMSQLKVSKFTLDEDPKNADADAVNADAVNTPNEAVEKVEPSQNAALSSQKPSSSHAVKATGRSIRKTSQAVDSEVESQTIQTDISPLISKKKKPAKETPTVIPKSSHKISTRKARSSRSVAPSTPSSKILVPVQCMPMFKTPKNVSSNRRAVLDMLINSDSDEDASSSLKTSKSKKKQTIAAAKTGSARMKTGQQKSESAANKSKTLVTPNVRFDLLSPSGGNKMKTKSPIATLFKASLNRSVAMDMGTENVFDFILSSPEETPLAARGKKKPSKPGRKPRDGRARKTSQKVTPEADIEVKRECTELKDSDCVSNQNAEIVDCQNEELDISNEVSLRDTTAKDCSQFTAKKAMGTRKKGVPKAKPDAKPEVIAKRTRAPTMKLTRSKTAVLETHRDALLSNDDDDDDSLSLSFETSVCMPDEESASEPSLYFIPSPAHRVPSPGLCDMSDTLRSLSGVLHIKHPSYYLGPPLSPGEVILPHMNGALLESVQEEDPLLCQEDVTQLDIPAAWLDEPMEVMRGDTEVEPKGKTLRNTRKLKPKQTGRAAQLDTGTEVPRLSTPLPKQLSDDELKSSHEKEAKEKEDQIMATPPQPLAEDLCGHLNRAFALLSHHPTPIPYRKVCHAQTLVELARPQPAPWSLAFYLTEAHAVSFRYSALSNISRKMRKLPCDGAADSYSGVQVSRLRQMQKEIAFGQSVTDLKTTMDRLPADWTVVQVSVLAALGVPCGSLVITRFTAGEDPIVVQLPGFATTLGQKLLQDFSMILKSNHTTMAVTNKVQWWSERHALNEHIKEVLEDMEGRWLGAWVGLLQGRPDNDEDETRLEEAATALTKCFQKLLEGPKKAVRGLVSRQLVKLLLRSYHLLDQNLVTSLVCELCHVSVDHDVTSELLGRVSKAGKGLNLAVSAHCRPVLLVLDRAVQHLPWESLPSVRGQPLTRVPSVHFLNAHLGALRSDPTSIFSTGVDRKKTFYILNPDDNLSSTQSAFEAKFKAERGWKGVVGKPPTADEYTAGLTENDLFIFCGHGGGAKFLPGAQLAALRCHAAVLLMGCSSGKLVVDGQLEATGMMLNYFLAGCPCITACLWDVTDKDIDRFLEDLLDRCSKAVPGTSLLDCVHQSRDVCRLPYLIGAAPAVYGLPVSLRGAAT